MLYTSPRQPNPSIQPSIHPHILPRCYIHLRRAFIMILYQRINLPFLLLLSLKCSDMSMIKSRLLIHTNIPKMSSSPQLFRQFCHLDRRDPNVHPNYVFLAKMFPKEFFKSSFKEQHLKHHSILCNDELKNKTYNKYPFIYMVFKR